MKKRLTHWSAKDSSRRHVKTLSVLLGLIWQETDSCTYYTRLVISGTLYIDRQMINKCYCRWIKQICIQKIKVQLANPSNQKSTSDYKIVIEETNKSTQSITTFPLSCHPHQSPINSHMTENHKNIIFDSWLICLSSSLYKRHTSKRYRNLQWNTKNVDNYSIIFLCTNDFDHMYCTMYTEHIAL